MATEVGTGYVRLLPSMKGFSAQAKTGLNQALGGPAVDAGAAAGKKGAKGFKAGFGGALKSIGAGAAIFGGISFLQSAFSSALEKAALPNQMRQQFALTEPVAAQAAKTAGQLYSSGWGQSLSEVGNVVGTVQRELNRLGTGESVPRLTKQAQALAQTFGQDVGRTITAASQLVRTGLAPNMEAAFDVMTRGFQSGADSGEDFLDTITEYSGQFQKLGLDASTSFGIVNQALAAGARNSDLVADAIKEFSIRAVDGSKLTAEGFQAIGLTAEDMTDQIAKGGDAASEGLQEVLDGLRDIKDPAAQSQAAVALFGTQAEDLGAALYAMDPAAAAATGGMKNVDGAAQNAADTMGQSLQAQLTSLSRTFQAGLGSALTTVLPLLTGLLTVLRPLLPVLGPMAIAIGLVTAATWLYNAALNANPLVRIVALIAGLIAVLAVAWQQSETFRAVVTAVWNGIRTAIGAVVGWFVNTVWPLLKGVWSGISGAAGAMRDVVVGAWNAVVGAARTAVRWIVDRWNWLRNALRGIADGVKNMLAGMWDGVTAGAKAALNGAIGIVNGAIGGLNFLIDGANLIPGVNIPHIPEIAYLAKGGIVTDATLAMIGEGPEDEAVMPLSTLDSMLSAAPAAPAAAATVVIDGRGLPRALKEWLQYAVRTQGAGTVQGAFGTARA